MSTTNNEFGRRMRSMGFTALPISLPFDAQSDFLPLIRALDGLKTDGSLSTAELKAGFTRLDPGVREDGLMDEGVASKAALLIATAFKISKDVNIDRKSPLEVAQAYADSQGINYAGATNPYAIGPTRVLDNVNVPVARHTAPGSDKFLDSIAKIQEFFGKTIADGKYKKGTNLFFANSSKEFADHFFKLHPDQVGQISQQEIEDSVGFNGPKPNGTRDLVINLEAIQRKGDVSYFGGSLLEETVAHEYAHSIQKIMSPDWGNDGDPDTEAYKAVVEADPQVSVYSDKNISEHFAENFARFVISGQATDEFKEYLKARGIEQPNIDNVFHPMMRENVEAELNAVVNSDDSPVTFQIEIGGPTKSRQDVMRMLTSGQAPSEAIVNSRSMQLKLIAKDPSQFGGARELGRGNGSLTIDSQGKLSVSGDLLSFMASSQGQGIGSAFLKQIAGYISANGGGAINLIAGLDNGPYMWAISGFKFRNDSDRSKYTELSKQLVPFTESWMKAQGLVNNLSREEKQNLYTLGNNTDESESFQSLAPEIRQMLLTYRTLLRRVYLDRGKSDPLRMALEGKWDLTDEDFQNLLAISMSQISDRLEPIAFASIGRKSKAEDGEDLYTGSRKKSSSFGRMLMLLGNGWSGRLDIPAMPRPKTEGN